VVSGHHSRLCSCRIPQALAAEINEAKKEIDSAHEKVRFFVVGDESMRRLSLLCFSSSWPVSGS
jgi:hypothetical protein